MCILVTACCDCMLDDAIADKSSIARKKLDLSLASPLRGSVHEVTKWSGCCHCCNYWVLVSRAPKLVVVVVIVDEISSGAGQHIHTHPVINAFV